jgi:hypothetical protein
MDIAALFNQQVTFLQGTVPVITMDCSISETHDRDSTPTEFEIENGQTVSDHIVLKPFSLKIQGVISDAPLFGVTSLLKSAATTAVTAKANNPGVLGAKAAAIAALPLFSGLFSPSSTSYQTLLNYQAARFPLNVVTSLHLYPNMWIKKISVPRDAKSGGALVVTLDLVQLTLVLPTSVNIAQFAVADLAASAANKGAQQATAASEGAAIVKAGFIAGGAVVGGGE